MIIELDMYQTLAIAVVVLMLGKFLRKKCSLLEKFCIPAPVVGGVLVMSTLTVSALRSTGSASAMLARISPRRWASKNSLSISSMPGWSTRYVW